MLAQTLKDLGGNQAPSRLPREYQKIKEHFQKAKEDGKLIILENNEFRSAYSVKMKLEYIGDRWCMGRVRYVTPQGEIYVPYTIHYSDMVASDSPTAVAKNMTIIFKGENPFGTRYTEGAGED